MKTLNYWYSMQVMSVECSSDDHFVLKCLHK